MTSTADSVTSSSSPSMPAKAAPRSAIRPAGPAMCTSAPAADASAAARMPSMTAPSGFLPSASTAVTLSADSGTSTSAACPSWDGISGTGTG